MQPAPEVSIIIPVYNEQESLKALFERLFPVLNKIKSRGCEVIFINDGSKDASLPMLLSNMDNDLNLFDIKIINFNGNFGQHMAIMAGFAHATGQKIITMDADLQNPPEEIPNILNAMDAGHDVVGTHRANRKDPIFRKTASKLINKITNKITGLGLKDYGCMLRGYDRRIVDLINDCKETTTFLPALAQKFAINPTDIPVGHSQREQGESKYGLYRLIRLNFDLMAGFSLVPLQAVTMLGLLISLLSFLFGIFLVIRRIFVGPEAEGLFTLMAINFTLMGIILFSVGIAGEYVGRIYQEVRQRPRYVIKDIYERNIK